MRLLAIGLSCAFFAISSLIAHAQTVEVRATPLDKPSDTSISNGDVYGSITFSSPNKSTANIQNFLNILVAEQFGSDTEGNFLVSLAVSQSAAAKPLAERPILTGTRKDKKFLWITTQRSVTGELDINGTLLDGIIVQNTNNVLRASLKIYFSDKVTFDTKVYADLLKLADAARAAAGLIALPALITGNTDSIAKLVETALSRERSEEKTLATEMSFIVNGATRPPPNRQKFDVTARGADGGSAQLNITLEFQKRDSIIGEYDPSKAGEGPNRKGFSAWALPGKFIDRATVTVGSEKISVAQMIEQSGPKPIATAWSMLNNGPYDASRNGNVPIDSVCRDLYALVRSVFSERDAVGLYWDILHDLRVNLARTTGAVNCVRAREPLFAYHGLSTSLLADIRN